METWLEHNWWWMFGLALGASYIGFGVFGRRHGERIPQRMVPLNPFLDPKGWTTRALILAALMIAIAGVAILFDPGGRK